MTRTYRFFFGILLFCTLAGSSSFVNIGASGYVKVRTIVIDAGHGGDDRGAAGVYSKEKDVALKMALALGKAITEQMPDVNVVYTRTTDVRIKLYDRIGLANKIKADLFISIHCNSLPYNKAGRGSFKGAETLLSGSGRLGEQDVALRENASILQEKDYQSNYDGYDPKDIESMIILGMMKNSFRRQSITFAAAIQEQYKQSGRIDRGVREQSLAVLARAGMPAVLTEIGYISSPEEENYLNSETGQREVIGAIVAGIQSYRAQSDHLVVE